MTFLHDDIVLYKFLSDAGLIDQINKTAQNAQAQAKNIAIKLAQDLLTTQGLAGANLNEKSADIYTRHLVDLTAFLNYLLANNKQASDEQPIVLQSQGTNSKQPPDKFKNLYNKYDDFWVHMQGLQEQFANLQQAAEQKGNEALRPFVKHLLDEAKSKMKTDFTMQKDPRLIRDDPYGADAQKYKHPYQVNMAIDESTAEEAAREDSSQQSSKSLKEDIVAMRNYWPFQAQNVISPYDMVNFIGQMNILLHKHPNMIVGPMLGTFEGLDASIKSQYTDWANMLGEIKAKTPNLAILPQDDVPYARGSQPNNKLETIFGGHLNAMDAARKLNHMILTVEQGITSLNRSSQIIDLLGKDILSGQLSEAQKFSSELSSFAR